MWKKYTKSDREQDRKMGRLDFIKRGLKNATLWFIPFVIFGLVFTVLDDSNAINVLVTIDFYVSMAKHPLFIILYIVIVTIFSIVAFNEQKK